jgi:hypothetical protein
MRFTGSEIFRDPRGCAEEVGKWIVKAAELSLRQPSAKGG